MNVEQRAKLRMVKRIISNLVDKLDDELPYNDLLENVFYDIKKISDIVRELLDEL